MQPTKTMKNWARSFQAGSSRDTLANGSYLENPTVDGPSVGMKQIDIGRLNNKEMLWRNEIRKDNDYAGDECDTFNDR